MLRRPRPPLDPTLATLRRRTAHLIAAQSPTFRAFIRALPLLLCTRLRRPSFEAEPPGLVRAPRRRRWGRLCEQLDLPPPTTWYPIRPLVQSALLVPNGENRFELLIIPLDGLSRSELARVAGRVDALQHLAQRHAPTLDVRMAGAGELTASVWAWASIAAGEVPPATERTTTLDWLEVFSRAPNPLLRCLTLLVPRDTMSPLQHLRSGVTPARPLAFVAHWSGHPLARDLASLLDQPLSPAEFDGLSQRFRNECLRALRAIGLQERKPVHCMIRAALMGRRVPPVLRPQLERLLRARHCREVRTSSGWQYEIEGFVLARAKSLDQLRAFVLAEAPQLVTANGTDDVHWSKIREIMSPPVRSTEASQSRRPFQPRGVVVVQPGFLRHLVAIVPKSGRPRVQRVDAAGLLRFVLLRHREGVPLELVPTAGCDPTLMARAAQLLTLTVGRREHVAFQFGREVLLLGDGAPRVFPIERAFTRPRRVIWLPEQAEHLRALRTPSSAGLPTVHVIALPDGAEQAAIFALDSNGSIFRDQVPCTALEGTLQEYREALRLAEPPVLVSATVHPFLTSLNGRLNDRHPPLLLEVELSARGDVVELEGERFGAGELLSWPALAEAVLSRWAPGTWARVVIARVKAPSGTPPLALLAARSRVLRRLHVQLRRIAQALRAA